MPTAEKTSSPSVHPLLTDDGFRKHFGLNKADMPNEIKLAFYFFALNTSEEGKQLDGFETSLYRLKQLDEFFSQLLPEGQ